MVAAVVRSGGIIADRAGARKNAMAFVLFFSLPGHPLTRSMGGPHIVGPEASEDGVEIDEQVEVFAQRDVYAGADAGDGYPDRAFQATAGPPGDSSVPERFGAFGLRPILAARVRQRRYRSLTRAAREVSSNQRRVSKPHPLAQAD